MARKEKWALGVDLGGTKILVGQVGMGGKIYRRVLLPTEVSKGPAAVKAQVISAVEKLVREAGEEPAGVGVGVAGQVEALTGLVRFGPNLGWVDDPLQEDLHRALGLPVFVINDVRAATWGEWLHGAGRGCDDLVCVFVGTGIGGGVVSGGKVLTGFSNTAGELGHIPVKVTGPLCRCGNRGCMEALAGGWAIARDGKKAVKSNSRAGSFLMKLGGGRIEGITAKWVFEAAKAGDPLSLRIVGRVIEALSAGAVSLVNAFNPRLFILGGGVVKGYPQLVKGVAAGVKERALPASRGPVRFVRPRLGNNAGVVGAAALVLHTRNPKS